MFLCNLVKVIHHINMCLEVSVKLDLVHFSIFIFRLSVLIKQLTNYQYHYLTMSIPSKYK